MALKMYIYMHALTQFKRSIFSNKAVTHMVAINLLKPGISAVSNELFVASSWLN